MTIAEIIEALKLDGRLDVVVYIRDNDGDLRPVDDIFVDADSNELILTY